MILVHSGVMVPAHDAPAVANGAVAVEGTTITDLGTFEELSARYPDAQVIGGIQFLLIPGLINGHGHGRGLSSFQRSALDNTLESWIWDTRKFKPLPIYDDVSYCAAKLLKSGMPWGEKSYEQGISEVVNDIHRDLTNFWRVLQREDTFTAFRRCIEAVPFSEVEWEDAESRQHAQTELDVEAALAFFIRCRQSRAGAFDSASR